MEGPIFHRGHVCMHFMYYLPQKHKRVIWGPLFYPPLYITMHPIFKLLFESVPDALEAKHKNTQKGNMGPSILPPSIYNNTTPFYKLHIGSHQ